jgi:hypothetical protein
VRGGEMPPAGLHQSFDFASIGVFDLMGVSGRLLPAFAD